jgi:hypothetical protein
MSANHLISWLLTSTSLVFAIGQQPIITFQPSVGTINLASRNSSVQIILNNLEWPAVERAAKDLALDFGRVTGRNGSVHSLGTLNGSSFSNFSKTNWNNSTTFAPEGAIIVGTLGRSPVIDQLVNSGKIHIESIAGQWESFISTVVDSPIPGLSKALVIVGLSPSCCCFILCAADMN